MQFETTLGSSLAPEAVGAAEVGSTVVVAAADIGFDEGRGRESQTGQADEASGRSAEAVQVCTGSGKRAAAIGMDGVTLARRAKRPERHVSAGVAGLLSEVAVDIVSHFSGFDYTFAPVDVAAAAAAAASCMCYRAAHNHLACALDHKA